MDSTDQPTDRPILFFPPSFVPPAFCKRRTITSSFIHTYSHMHACVCVCRLSLSRHSIRPGPADASDFYQDISQSFLKCLLLLLLLLLQRHSSSKKPKLRWRPSFVRQSGLTMSIASAISFRPRQGKKREEERSRRSRPSLSIQFLLSFDKMTWF